MTEKIMLRFDMDFTVEVLCIAQDCAHNLVNYNGNYACELKHLTIEAGGACARYAKSAFVPIARSGKPKSDS